MSDVGKDLSARLRARLPELEEACLREIHAIGDPNAVADPSYREGLGAAASAALAYGLDAFDEPAAETSTLPVPSALLSQVRTAAHLKIGLETILRRCYAGDSLLRSALIEESLGIDGNNSTLKRLLFAQADHFNRLIEAVAREHRKALEARQDPAVRLIERLKRLLAGEPIDTAEIAYEFGSHHVAMIIAGRVDADSIRGLGKTLRRRVLVASPTEGITWAWLGGRQELDYKKLRRAIVARKWSADIVVAVGESNHGLSGWRITHRQAQEALTIAALRDPSPVTRYADVAIEAALLPNEFLVDSLRQLYIAPLEIGHDGGLELRRTLRALPLPPAERILGGCRARC